MNSNMMNRNSMRCINRGGMNTNNSYQANCDMNHNDCGCSDNMQGNNSCNRSYNNGCGTPDDQQLMSMNQNQLLSYLNQVSFSMYDTTLFLDTHPADQEALAYFTEMQQARKRALKIYQKKFAPLLLDGVDADCEWTWGMEPLPWENC